MQVTPVPPQARTFLWAFLCMTSIHLTCKHSCSRAPRLGFLTMLTCELCTSTDFSLSHTTLVFGSSLCNIFSLERIPIPLKDVCFDHLHNRLPPGNQILTYSTSKHPLPLESNPHHRNHLPRSSSHDSWELSSSDTCQALPSVPTSLPLTLTLVLSLSPSPKSPSLT
jgi:hypothetical protein